MEADDVRLAPVDGDIDRRFGLPGLELLDVPEMVTVASQSASLGLMSVLSLVLMWL